MYSARNYISILLFVVSAYKFQWIDSYMYSIYIKIAVVA